MKYFYETYTLLNPYRSHTPRGFYDPVKGHTGEDYNTATGTPLTLPVKTTVLDIGKQAQMGNTLYLTAPTGEVIVFAHLSQINVTVGQEIPADMVFAETGNTGSATTGPHVHTEIIASKPEPGGKGMTRTLNGISGFNIEPSKFFKSLAPYTENEGLNWCYKHKIISSPNHGADEIFTKEETSIMMKRLAKQILKWSKDEKS